MDKDKIILFRNAIGLLLLTLVVFIYLLVAKIIPGFQALGQTYTDYKTQIDTLAEKERTLDTKQQAAQKAANEIVKMAKEIYKPIEPGLDSTGIITLQFDDILDMLKANSIKTRSVKYNYNPADDVFVKGSGDKLSVCELDMQMVATYKNFEGLLKDLYKHEHFLDLSKIEIIPYTKDKSVLLISFKLKLYASKA